VRKAMQNAIEERYGVRWEELEVGSVASRLAAKALVIHDRDDRMMPWTHGAKVAEAWPGGELMLTEGLGHGRILRDERVSRAAAEFICE
jgi:pimeloyl-ACP methyl ester carboxylesterase